MAANEHITTLFRKYLSGTYSPDELDELLGYFELEEGAGQLTRLMEEALANASPDAVDSLRVKAIQDRVAGRLPLIESAKPIRRLSRWLPYAAAAVLIVALVGFFFFDTIRDNREVVAITEILPGSNRATLTLADGRTIDLSETQTGIVVGDGITYLDGSAVGPEVSHSAESEEMVLRVPEGGTYQLTLADGTQVWLNAASTLTYPSRFDDSERRVRLHGEGYFSVARDAAKPFRVLTDNQTVEVLGTEFNISAYADEPAVRTTLVEGSVRLSLMGESSGSTSGPIMLRPGQQAIAHGSSFDVQDVDVQPYTAWKDGYFRFQKLPITEIMRQLARWYDIEVQYEGPIKEMLYSGRISRQAGLAEVLRIMESADVVQFEIHDSERRIIVKH